MEHSHSKKINIIGLGYVGLTLAAAFLSKGRHVTGIEVRADVRAILNEGKVHLYEPGLEATIARTINHTFHVVEELPDDLEIVIICVGTPFDKAKNEPQHSYLKAALEEVAKRMTDETLIVIRSTLAIGTTREVVLPILRSKVPYPKVVVAPERTIQGKAIEELMRLPQIIGTHQHGHYEEAKALFDSLGVESINVSSYEAAEMVKLICNSHTDILYGFGNEVAAIAEGFHIDALEVIQAANYHYPRPDIALPGYVGGSCLTKDPYHLMYASMQKGYEPKLIAAARTLNEALPVRIIEQIEAILIRQERLWSDMKVTLSGFAYKGYPETDDLRGSPVWDILDLLKARGVKFITGHDYIVNDESIKNLNVIPIVFEEAIHKSDIVIILNNHVSYQNVNVEQMVQKTKEAAIIYDLWGVFRKGLQPYTNKKFDYLGVGYIG